MLTVLLFATGVAAMLLPFLTTMFLFHEEAKADGLPCRMAASPRGGVYRKGDKHI